MASGEYRRERRKHYQDTFLGALQAPEAPRLPSIPLRREERIALRTLRYLVATGAIKP